MSAQDRVRWDGIYRQRQGQPFPPPDPLLFEYTPPLRNGETRTALDLAAGLGQNGLWLASQGYLTDIMEISRVALQRARGEMAMRNLRNVNLLQVDLDEIELEPEKYDVVCTFRYLKRGIFPQLSACVLPGARVVYETFNIHYLDDVPRFNKAFLLEPGEILSYFPDWRILHHDEEGSVTQFVARKPG